MGVVVETHTPFFLHDDTFFRFRFGIAAARPLRLSLHICLPLSLSGDRVLSTPRTRALSSLRGAMNVDSSLSFFLLSFSFSVAGGCVEGGVGSALAKGRVCLCVCAFVRSLARDISILYA